VTTLELLRRSLEGRVIFTVLMRGDGRL